MTQTPYEQALRAEIAALRRIVAASSPHWTTVDAETQQRIVRYLVDRYTPKQ